MLPLFQMYFGDIKFSKETKKVLHICLHILRAHEVVLRKSPFREAFLLSYFAQLTKTSSFHETVSVLMRIFFPNF
jgi:hypothetical protein